MPSSARSLLDECAARLREFVRETPVLAAELAEAERDYEGSRAPSPDEAERTAARARCFEWFAFERPSRRFGEIPYLTFLRERGDRLPPPLLEYAERMSEEVFGVFEVTSVDSECGPVVADLRTGREYLVREEDAGAPAEVGDTLVGRLFPGEEGEYLLSPAVTWFRDPVLREALARDLSRTIADIPGARLSQIELERLFWPAAEADEGAREGASEIEPELRRVLSQAALPGLDVDAVRRAFLEVPAAGPVIGPILDRVAFESSVDLERLRRLLWAFWSSVRTGSAPARTAPPAAVPEGARTSRVCSCGSGERYDECCRAKEAVEAFERGLSRGEDLEALFGRLETDLGLEEEESADDGEETAALPIANDLEPLVQEYLWERTRESRAPAPVEPTLRAFEAYLTRVADPAVQALADIEPSHVHGFAAHALASEAVRGGLAAADSLATDLADFFAWADREHGEDLDRRCGAALRSVRADLARLVRIRESVAPSGDTARSPKSTRFVVAVAPPEGSPEALVQPVSAMDAESSPPLRVVVPPAFAPLLREGDVVDAELDARAGPDGSRTVRRVIAVLPAWASSTR